MSSASGPCYGRAAMIGVLIALLLTVSAAVGIFLARYDRAETVLPLDVDVEQEYAKRMQMVTLLTILLISALLILLFVVGSYLLIRVGRVLARSPLGGKPTPYVDAWRNYRLTDEQIAEATAEQEPGNGRGGGPADADFRPFDSDPDSPSSKS